MFDIRLDISLLHELFCCYGILDSLLPLPEFHSMFSSLGSLNLLSQSNCSGNRGLLN